MKTIYVTGHDVLAVAGISYNDLLATHTGHRAPRKHALSCPTCGAAAHVPCASKGRQHTRRGHKTRIAYVAAQTILPFVRQYPQATIYGQPRKVSAQRVPYTIVARYHDVAKDTYVMCVKVGIDYRTVVAKVNHVRFVD